MRSEILKRAVEAAHKAEAESVSKAWKVGYSERLGGRARMVGDKTPPSDWGLEDYASPKTRQKQHRRFKAQIEADTRRNLGGTKYGMKAPDRSIKGEWQAVQRIRRGNLRRMGSYSPSK